MLDLESQDPNLHNIARSDRIRFKMKNSHKQWGNTDDIESEDAECTNRVIKDYYLPT